MLSPDQVEELNDSIQSMDRGALIYQLQHFQCRFPVDFTPEFYQREPLHRLRHILFGLCLHNQQTIDVAAAA
ncbi:MAG: hypothetical protein H7144_11420 [Burkholderiales bacterium]|nr:hypothetical protein [Phycisphaerae bacterium]